MPVLIILVLLVLVGGVILISVQERALKKANKLNAEQSRAINATRRERDAELQQLTSYTEQNPLDAYKLLVEHVSAAKKRKR